MKRIALTENGEETGRYFDLEKAQKYAEGSTWNGSNHISDATGSQWEHEMLFRTKGGTWVLNSYSQCQGTLETYEIISTAQAAEWFVRNNYKDDDLPEDQDIRARIAKLEV